MEIAIICLILSYCFAPKLCAIGIANPLQTPLQNPIIIKLIAPVDPTPAYRTTPNLYPTIKVSTILKTCRNSMPSSSGTAKLKINLSGLPDVISLVAFFAILLMLLF